MLVAVVEGTADGQPLRVAADDRNGATSAAARRLCSPRPSTTTTHARRAGDSPSSRPPRAHCGHPRPSRPTRPHLQRPAAHRRAKVARVRSRACRGRAHRARERDGRAHCAGTFRIGTDPHHEVVREHRPCVPVVCLAGGVTAGGRLQPTRLTAPHDSASVTSVAMISAVRHSGRPRRGSPRPSQVADRDRLRGR